MRTTRTLENIYWNDEGEAAVRWLIGKINYGPHRETRNDLRKSPLESVQRWAGHTKNVHLNELATLVLAGEPVDAVRMNPRLGANERLVAVAASAVLIPLAGTCQLESISVDEDTAYFTVTRRNITVDVAINPVMSSATSACRQYQEGWSTQQGSQAMDIIVNLLDRLERAADGNQ